MPYEPLNKKQFVFSGTQPALIANLNPASYPAGTNALVTGLSRDPEIFVATSTKWRPISPMINLVSDASLAKYLVFGGAAGTYSQTGTTITVTHAAHLLVAADQNGSNCHLTFATGAAITGWFTNLTYVDANTFTVTSTVSQSTSGNLSVAGNTSETFLPRTDSIPANLIMPRDRCNLAGFRQCKASAGTKTFRGYFDSVLITAAQTVTTGGTFAALSYNVQFFDTATTYYNNTDTTKKTFTTRDYTSSIQLTTGSDWAMFAVYSLPFQKG